MPKGIMPEKRNRSLTMGLLALCLPVAACHSGPVVTGFDGTYTGEATNVSSGVYNCEDSRTTNPMVVSGGEASFGDFRGWVSPAGALQMQSWKDSLSGSAKDTVSGQFTGNRFTGELNLGQSSGFVCKYTLALSR